MAQKNLGPYMTSRHASFMKELASLSPEPLEVLPGIIRRQELLAAVGERGGSVITAQPAQS